MLNMANAASAQALEEGKKRLREFLETSETGRAALAMPASSSSGGSYEMGRMSEARKRVGRQEGEAEGDDVEEI